MANSDYDEDLEQNPFFVAVRRNYPDLFQQCISDGHILAVPRRGAVAGIESVERDAAFRHVIVASDDFSETSRLVTLDSVAEVVVDGGDVRVTGVAGGEGGDVVTKLLFVETFYDDDMNKVQLW
jgi:hypothetical protein